MRESRPLAAALWMTIAQALFAVMGVSARIGGQGLPWQEIVATRFLIGALTAMAVAIVLKKSLRVKNQKAQFWRSAFGTAAAAATFFTYAAPELAIGDAVTLFGTSPIFVAILSWPLLGEKVGANVVVALVFAFAGIALVAHPTFHTAGYLVGSGTLAAVTTALAMIWLRRMGPDESSEGIVFQFSLFGGMISLLMCIPVWRSPNAHDAAYLLLTGFSGGLAQIAMTRAYSLDRAARVSSFQYLAIVFTRAIAFPVFGERPTLVAIAGSVLVIGAGIVLALRGEAAARAAVSDG